MNGIKNERKKTYYVYSEAAIGNNAHVTISEAPNGEPTAATIHSHGNYDENYYNNNFSAKDRINSVDKGVDAYLTTPDGSLKKYNPETRETTVVSTDLPSDPNDPERKNEVKPVDIPATKEQDKRQDRQRTEAERRTEAEQKREAYKNSYMNR